MTLRSLALAVIAAWLAVAPAAAIDLTALKGFACPADDGGFVDAAILRHCGTIRMSEGADGLGLSIDIAVMVLIPSDPEAAHATPTVFAHGGPGGALLDGWWSVGMLALAREGPLVLFDQRSVGRSGPRLCPFLDTDDPARDRMTAAELKKHAVDEIKRCATWIKDKRRDPAAYGTLATVRDMENIRRALGIERWNVYGVSYGTAVVLAYLAAHPDRVRAAVVDSVYPPEMDAFSTMLPDFMASFEAMNRACTAQPRCRTRFGDLKTLLDQALDNLAKKPLPVETTDFKTYEVEDRHLAAPALYGLVQTLMLERGKWHLVPLVLADVRDARSSALVNAVVSDQLWSMSFMSNGAYWATECYERAPFDDAGALDRQKSRWPTLAGNASIDTLFAICDAWPARADRSWETPRNVTTPVLVMGGEWDPVTPAEQARLTTARLGPKAQLVIAPKTAHAVSMADPCTERMVADFLAAPDTTVDASCLANRRAPTFATRMLELDPSTAWQPSLLPITSWIFIAGLLSVIAWPLAWLASAARTAAPWHRSAFWLTTASLAALAGVAGIATTLLTVPDTAWSWTQYGIPAEEWRTFPLLTVAFAAAVAGGFTLVREFRADTLSTLQLTHRGFVLTSLVALALSLARLGLLAQLPAHTLYELGQLL